MKKIIRALLTVILCLGVTTMSAQAAENGLTAKEKSMVSISALAGAGDLPNLEKALENGLQNGLTLNEIKELLVQVYAYAGFPRSLNGLQTFSALLDKRKAQGIEDVMGKEASPMPKDKTSLEFGTENQTNLFKREVKGGLYDFAPMIDYCLKAHLFGDLFQRDVLTWKDRELMTVGILAGVGNVNPQLMAHLATCHKISGWTKEQLFDYVNVIHESLGEETAKNVQGLVEQVVQK